MLGPESIKHESCNMWCQHFWDPFNIQLGPWLRSQLLKCILITCCVLFSHPHLFLVGKAVGREKKEALCSTWDLEYASIFSRSFSFPSPLCPLHFIFAVLPLASWWIPLWIHQHRSWVSQRITKQDAFLSLVLPCIVSKSWTWPSTPTFSHGSL